MSFPCSPFDHEARVYLSEIFPIAKSLFEMAMEDEDEYTASCIARLVERSEVSLSDRLLRMKQDLSSSPEAETYLSFFRKYFRERGLSVEGF